ncbi:MAG TPA: DUF2264 domain-containing protein [Bacillota bacterium]|nr:DUF2264 domain-containing protein [Bacillota bacterium]
MNSSIYDREYWIAVLEKIAQPVLQALAERKLKKTMPVEGIGDERYDRRHFSHLEALARTLVGTAPWLECPGLTGAEESLRQTYCSLARRAIDAGTDPDSPDYMNFSFSYQPIVDAAFLAQAVLRAPCELWNQLEPRVRCNLVNGLKATRSRKPHYNNWLLFSAMIETALFKMGEDWDRMRVDYALRQHQQWYLGDGYYGDGPEFHWDFYNSFVIQPMLVEIIRQVGPEEPEWAALEPDIRKRARRYGEIQERLISPEGTFPAIGRSLAYRFGAFQHLALMALQHNLPEGVAPAQVRCALTAVIRRMMEAPGTFDERGFLTVGFCGRQPEVGEMYISTGSLYLCTGALLPLGLSPEDEFWMSAPEDWTAKKIWSGANVSSDHALDHSPI